MICFTKVYPIIILKKREFLGNYFSYFANLLLFREKIYLKSLELINLKKKRSALKSKKYSIKRLKRNV